MKLYAKCLMLMVVVLASSALFAQSGTANSPHGTLEVAIGYKFSYANTTSPYQFWQNGGSVELHGQFWKGLGVVGRVDVLHNSDMQHTGVGLDLVTTVAGPRYTWTPGKSRFSYYGEVLGGNSKGLNSQFPVDSGFVASADSAAFLLGGGVNYHIKKWLGVRLLDTHWMRTDFPNATTGNQNTLVAGAGVVFRLP
ncbi:hypothetical protein ACOBR2_21165 (plasmid) [Telmatobacter bradus]|uniref:hypothetical protein n=1 Tax=Telmatobacter bradus TaxID=474953 RepID=UPI003B42AAD5